MPDIVPPANDFFSGFALALSLVLMLMTCFFGYRLKKVFITVCGAAIGLILGAAIGAALLQSIPVAVVLGLTLAAILGLISFKMYRVGIFIWTVFSAFTVACDLLTQLFDTSLLAQSIWPAVISSAVALAAGILALRFMRPVIIVTTAFNGGFSAAFKLLAPASSLLPHLFSEEVELIAALSLGVLLTVFGLLVQFKVKKGRSRRKR